MTAAGTIAPTILRTATETETARWIGAQCRNKPRLTAAIGITSVASACLQVLPLFLLGHVVDGAAQGGPPSALFAVGGVLVAVAIAGAVMAGASTYLIGRLGAQLLAQLREAVVRVVLGMPTTRLEEVGRGDVLSRVGDDVAVVSKGIRTAVPMVFSAGVLVVIATAGMFSLDWRLGLAGAGALPAYYLALRWYLPRSEPLYQRQREAQAERAQALISGLHGIDTVRAYRLEKTVVERVTAESRRVRDLGIEVFHLFGRFVGRENRAEFIGLGLIILVAFVLLENGSVSIGQAAVAPLIFHKLFVPLGYIMFAFDEVQKSGASLRRLVGVLAEPTDPQTDPYAQSRAEPRAVLVAGLSFRYPGADAPVLHDIDLEIPAGRSLALVGATGAGKSTLAGLIAGIGTPQTGSVRIGDTDLSSLTEAQARDLVSILTQETHVFAGSLAEDLRLAAPNATDDELREALHTVGADWALELLDRQVGAAGRQLDAAGVAHISLARIALRQTPVVVLDESTAEAGSRRAAAMERAAIAACRGRTTLFVAHRLTQAMAADRIAVLDAGRVVEQGTHDELIARQGRYAALWRAWRTGS